MAWMLQPKSFYQAMRPNFYTVAYRRSGAYKGMGSLGQGDQNPMIATALTPSQLAAFSTYNAAYFNQPSTSDIPGTPILASPGTGTTPSWLLPAVSVAVLTMMLMGRR